MNPTVSIDWLKTHLADADLILLDASLPATASGNPTAYPGKTIAGARFFDLKGRFSDKSSAFPNTLPSAAQFEAEARALGINSGSRIVVFDSMGLYSSPRVWWMFRAMGHANVAVLDGGLPAWDAQGLPLVDAQPAHYPTGDFTAQLQPGLVKSYQDVVENAEAPAFTVVDARSEGRFNGTAPEPRPELKSGRIPHSVNIPYGWVLQDGKLKSEAELKQLFAQRYQGADDLVFSCGSGLTACIVLLASEVAGHPGTAVYDGSWTEWAELQGLKNPAT